MVKIITDTGTSISPAQGEQLGIHVLPASLILNGEDLLDLVDITPAEFLPILRSGMLATSSQPSPGLVEAAFASASAEEPVLYVAIGEGLSGAYTSACAVRESMDNKEYITVFNCGSILGPQKVMALRARELAAQGKSVSEIVAALEVCRQNHKSYLIPQDLFHLQRGGRLTPAAAKVGSLLGLLPVISQSKDGRRLDKAALCRGYTKAVNKAIDTFTRMGADERYTIIVSHADNYKDAQLARVMLSAALPTCRYEIGELACALLNQGGPGCIVIQACRRE